jgi:RNA polymerase primary sigma factor
MSTPKYSTTTKLETSLEKIIKEVQYHCKNADLLEKYLKKIRNEARIYAKQQAKLIKKIKSGDIDAMEKLVKGHLRFIVSIANYMAKQYKNQGVSLPELVKAGIIGLIQCAQCNYESISKFEGFCFWWVWQSMLKMILEKRGYPVKRYRVKPPKEP